MDKTYYPLHLIIDGPDKVGKSTVVQLLSRKLDLPIIKMPNMKEYIEKGTTEEFSKLFNQTVVQFSEFSFIMDRGYPSSLVYSTVFNRESKLEYIKNIEELLQPVVVILYRQSMNELNEEIFSSIVEDDIDEMNISHDKISKGYRSLANKNGYILINTHNKTPQQICNEILTMVNISSEVESLD